MTTRTPSEQSPAGDPAADPPGRVLRVVLPNPLVLRFLVGLVVLAFGGMFFALEAAFARWAPWVPTDGMGALVTIVWGHHMLAVVRRERPVGIGLARAFGFAALTAVVIAGTFYVVQP